eukprot:TRINITY_DN109674_c0_g1_i1.p1 TRINITY_DN109674_c0_g1~~TRINITY_DN109674_c0_g1_i1.p1  ORF type:complete len:482 (-),score=88.99 TRINITY_DN109674_c0_g1_i1:25-1470(-)
MAGTWRVVHKPRVAVRRDPGVKADIVGVQHFGAILHPVEVSGDWLKLPSTDNSPSGWILSDGSSVGLGKLLERLDSQPLCLRVRHPHTGLPLPSLQLPGNTPVGEARMLLAKTGLEPSAVLPCKEGMSVISDAMTLYGAGFRDGDELTFAYTLEELPSSKLPASSGYPSTSASCVKFAAHDLEQIGPTLDRMKSSDASWEDVRAAVAGGWENHAIQALLDSLPIRSESGQNVGAGKAGALLFAWGMSPLLDRVEQDEVSRGQVVVLVLGWGGSTPSQLESLREWWRERGCATIASTRSPHDWAGQAARISSCIPEGAKVVVHAFSNNGMYLLHDLCQLRPAYSLVGVVVDSAPDDSLDASLLRQVANGCIRALCSLHSVALSERWDSALTLLEPAVEAQGAEISFPSLSGVLPGDVPALFMYSSSDTLIKASAVEKYIHAATNEGQARRVRFEGSQHVRHFQKHRRRYCDELGAFADVLGV